MKEIGGLSYDEFVDVFEEWNNGEFDSYLIEIIKNILKVKDEEIGKFIVDVIFDKVG